VGLLVVLGEAARVGGFALAGAVVIPADEPAAVRAAWSALSDDVAVVVLTERAAAALEAGPPGPSGPLSVVMPS